MAHRKEGALRRLEQSGSDDLNAPVEDRVTVKAKTQSAQSPHFNANDCAFYNSLQCIVQSESSYNINREDMKCSWLKKASLTVPMEDYRGYQYQ